jgi:DNA primase
LAGFSGRTTKTNAQQKYLNTSTTKIFAKGNILFNFFNVRQTNASQVIIVEGYMDAIAYCRAGHNNVVATMGVALSDEHINILKTLNSLDSVILSFDNDTAGIQATITNGYKLMENGINTFVVGKMPQDIKDIDELYTRSGKTEVDKILGEERDFISFLIEQTFQLKMPLNEIQKATNTIIQKMIDFDDASLL